MGVLVINLRGMLNVGELNFTPAICSNLQLAKNGRFKMNPVYF